MPTYKVKRTRWEWDLWLQWMEVSVLGLGLGLVVAGPVIGFGALLAILFGHELGAIIGAVTGGGGGALLGMVAGVGQRSMLRRHIVGPWVQATMAGYALSFALLTALFVLSTGALASCFSPLCSSPSGLIHHSPTPEFVLWSLGGAAMGTLVGTMQWLVLHRHISRAGWWVLASAAGSMAAALINYGLYSTVPSFSKSIGDWIGSFFLIPIVFGTVGGIGYAIITGAALVWLLRSPTPKVTIPTGRGGIENRK